jgi:hypothetical protein
MNVTARKILLGLSLTAYTWCSWDHLFTGKQDIAPAPKGKELTAAMINRPVVLKIETDPFHSAKLPLGDGSTTAAGAIDATGSAEGSTADGKPKPIELKLQGTLLIPPQRAAILNGKIVNEGDWDSTVTPPVRLQHVGQDFVVVEGATGTLTIKIEEPDYKSRPASASGGGGGGGGGLKMPYRPGQATAEAK